MPRLTTTCPLLPRTEAAAGVVLWVGMSTAATDQALLPGLQGADRVAESQGAGCHWCSREVCRRW